MHSDDWDGDPVFGDPDVTGDPQVDVLGYNSPRRQGQNLGGFTSTDGERKARADAREAADAAKRKADRDASTAKAKARLDERRKANALPAVSQPVPYTPPQPQVTGPLPGQHGAYFERRMVRVWYAPWRKRPVWQQVSAWHIGLPPTSGEVWTIASLDDLPGQVHQIGSVDENGTVVY